MDEFISTFLPISYQTSEDDSSLVFKPDSPDQAMNTHGIEMTEDGWSLISVQSLPAVHSINNTNCVVTHGMLLFWQRKKINLANVDTNAQGNINEHDIFEAKQNVHQAASEKQSIDLNEKYNLSSYSESIEASKQYNNTLESDDLTDFDQINEDPLVKEIRALKQGISRKLPK